MQHLGVIYHGMSHKSIELLRSQYTHEPTCVKRENTSDKWNIHEIPLESVRLTILHYTIENTVTNTMNEWRSLRRLGVADSRRTWSIVSNQRRIQGSGLPVQASDPFSREGTT